MPMLRRCLSFMFLAQAAAWVTMPGGVALRVVSGRGSVNRWSSKPSTKVRLTAVSRLPPASR